MSPKFFCDFLSRENGFLVDKMLVHVCDLSDVLFFVLNGKKNTALGDGSFFIEIAVDIFWLVKAGFAVACLSAFLS